MRLTSAYIKGYGRLVDAKINLDSKVIAIVGPNEAGKTTLLKALAHAGSDAPVLIPQRARGSQVADDATVVSLKYILDDQDRKSVADLMLDEPPQTMTVGRKAQGGTVAVGLQPLPRKARAPLTQAVKQLRRGASSKDLAGWVDPNTRYGDPDFDADFPSELANLVDDIDAILVGSHSGEDSDLGERASSLLSAILDVSRARALREGLVAVIEWMEREDPAPRVRSVLWRRAPDLLMFDENDRTIHSSYVLGDDLLANVPPALQNLAGVGQLDLAAIVQHVQSGDIARRDTAIAQANKRLDTLFEEAWRQSRLSVRFSVDGSYLRIVIWEDGDNITVFDERSAGLRMFVALIAFLKVHGTERPPILLIDEAENHLHIDAQADLVNMFVTQEQAVKVVYTTHSPACLPPDLGSGIRSVVPRKDNLQVSDIRNSFWQGAAGYSPLMLAMGAAAAAFTPARCVVLAEGATEMILLPTLLRTAIAMESLPYQVAPGLSEVPKDFYSKLDLEGAKVAYLLDGDGGGDELQKGLVRAGVSETLIVRLDVPGIENVLEPIAYLEALTAPLGECNTGTAVPSLPTLEDPTKQSWAKQLDGWITEQGLKAPSKVAVANWLVENDKARPSSAGAKQLRLLHRRLLKAVGAESESART
ncbi:AAA family ATPase [Arthrobacter celericrescens]|uniref:AAA family ATPase n=1 Tax=Arthrobacter celericrescens TaxID=2320851 RepID=UPI000EA20B7F|nr:AAA family ATPase [Arthrobacter celericrescens]